jgi:hypothetical protein
VVASPNEIRNRSGVLCDAGFFVIQAALILLQVVKEQALFARNSNEWEFVLRGRIWTLPGVVGITERPKQVELLSRTCGN